MSKALSLGKIKSKLDIRNLKHQKEESNIVRGSIILVNVITCTLNRQVGLIKEILNGT